jgi:hypothetical protein
LRLREGAVVFVDGFNAGSDAEVQRSSEDFG